MYVIQTDQTSRAMRALLHFDTTSITTTGQMSSRKFRMQNAECKMGRKVSLCDTLIVSPGDIWQVWRG